MHILQVNLLDESRGGASKVAMSLFHGFRERKHDSWLAVGIKTSSDRNVFLIRNGKGRNPWSWFWWRVHEQTLPLQSRVKWGERLRRVMALIPEPSAIIETW